MFAPRKISNQRASNQAENCRWNRSHGTEQKNCLVSTPEQKRFLKDLGGKNDLAGSQAGAKKN